MPIDESLLSLKDLYKNNKEDSARYKSLTDTSKLKLSMPTDDSYQGQMGTPLTGTNTPLERGQKLNLQGDYDFQLNQGSDYDEIRAKGQGYGELAGKAAIQSGSELVLGSLEGAGYLLDLPGIYNSFAQGELQFGNWFSDLMKEGQNYVADEVAPIYKTHAGEGFAPGDATWWASNAPQIVSAVSLALPSTGIVKGLTGLSRLTGIGSELAQGTKLALKGVTGAVISRYAENTMEASETMQSLISQLENERAQGLNNYSDDQIKMAGATAAQDTWNKNWANLITDIPQYVSMFKGFNPTRAAARESIAKNMGMEGLEEATQYVMGQEAQVKGRRSLGENVDSSFEQRMGNYLTDSELWTSAAFGALGGGAFAMLGNKRTADAEKANEQNRAAMFNDKKAFYDIQDDSFTELAVKHAMNGTLGKFEEEIKTIAKSPKESDVADNNINPEGFQTKVQERLNDLKFIEDSYTSIWNNSKLSEVQKAAKLDQVLQQRLKEKRLLSLNGDITKLKNEANVTLGLSPTMSQIKQLKLETEALQDVKELKNLYAEKQKTLSNLYIQAKKETGAKTNVDIDKSISHSNDADLVSKISDKYKLDYELGKIKDNLEKIETPTGKKVVENAQVKKAEAQADAFVKQLVAKAPTKQAAVDILKAALEQPGISDNAAASSFIEKKVKALETEVANDAVVAEKKNIETKPVIEPEKTEDVLATPLTDVDVNNINERLKELEGQPQLPTENANAALQELGAMNPAVVDIVKDYYKDVNTAKETPIVVDTEIDEVDTNVEFLNEPLVDTNTIGYKVAYFDKNDPSQWWKSDPESLPEGTELEFVYKDDPQIIAASILNYSKNRNLSLEPLQAFAKRYPNMINPIEIREKSSGRVVGFIPAFYNAEQAKANRELAEMRADIAKGVKYTSTVKVKGPGVFNNVPNKNFGNNKEEKIADTLGVENYEYYLGYGKGLNVIVPGNDSLNKAIFTQKATDGALYITVTAADGTVKPARALLRSINDTEANYLIGLISKATPENFEQVLNAVNHVTYVGNNSGLKDAKLYFNMNADGIVYYDTTIGSNVIIDYGLVNDIEALKNFLQSKRRRVDAKLINDFSRYTDPATGITYERGYNEFLSETYTVTSDLVAGAPFRQAAIYFEKPVKVEEKEVETSDIEVKKADIERRRQDAKNELQKFTDANSDLEITSPDNKNYKGAVVDFTSLDAKYDAELAALEETKVEEKPVERKRQARGASKLNPIRRSDAIRADKTYTVWDKSKELSWMKKNLPQVPIEVLDNLKEIYSNGGIDMWGLFANSMVYIQTNAITGTTFHEAFHAVFNLFLNEEQQTAIIAEAKRKYGIKTNDIETIEERLAEEFKAYVASNGYADKSLTGKIKDFFNRLYQTLKHIISPRVSLDELFYRINTGVYSRNKVLAPNAELAPTRTSVHPALTITLQKAAMDTLTYRFFEVLETIQSDIKQKYGQELDYSEILQDHKYPIDSIYNQIALDLVKDRDEDHPIYLIVDNMEDVKNDEGQVIIEGIRSKHKRYLAFYGYDVKKVTMDRDEYSKIAEIDEEQQEKEKWMFHYFEVSGLDKLSSRMRRFIGLTQAVDLKTGEVKLNEFDEYEVVDMYQTYSYLVRNLANILTLDEMMDELAQLSIINPSIGSIYETLSGSTDEFKNEFFTNFSKNNLKFVSVVYNNVYDDEGNLVSVDTRIIDSNRKSLKNTIFTEWYNNFRNIAISYSKDGKEAINKEVTDKFKQSFNELKTLVDGSKQFTTEIAKKAADTFKLIGINTPVESYSVFMRDTVEGKVKITGLANFRNKMFGINTPTMENIVHFLSKGQNVFLEEPNSINTFINQVINFEKELTEDSFRNVEGKTVYSYTNNNFISKWFSAVKGNDYKSFLQPYLTPAFNRSSIWLNKLLNSPLRSEFDIVTLDGLRENENGKTGVKFADMTAKEALITKINMYLNQGRNLGYYQMPTPADNPLLSFIKFDRIDNTALLDKVVDTIVKAEYARIDEATRQVNNVAVLKANDDPTWKDEENKLVKNYHWLKADNKLAKDGNAFKLQYITSEKLESYIGKTLTTSDIKEIKAEVRILLTKGVNDLKADLLEKGIIYQEKDYNDKLTLYTKMLDQRGIKKFDLKNNINPVMNALTSYYINSLIATTEITRLGIGDLAFYKKDASGLTTTDASKRTTELTTPGEDGNTDGAQFYKMVVLKTKEIDTPLYKDVDETDAQGYMSLARYLDILKRHGRWNNKIERAVADLDSGNATDESLSILLNPIKGYNYGHRFENGMVIPTQIKYSTIPLIPALTKDRPELEKLRVAMQENGIDEVIWDTAIKAGAQTMLDFDYFTGNTAIAESEKYTMKNSDWRWVQNVPEHHLDSDNLFGSQIRRLIMANIKEDDNYNVAGFDKPFTGKELKAFYQDLITTNVNSDLENVLSRFKDPKSLQKALLKEVQDRKLGEQYEKALQLRKGKLVIPPTMTKKFESILMSMFKNGVMKQRIKGITAVQVSKFGFESLNFVSNENGVVTQAECLLPWWSEKYFPKNENGEVDFSVIPDELKELVGYRIPTEGKHSMIPLIVKGFLPKESGSIIVLPSEITKQMGSDFDVDKMFIMLPEFDTDLNKIKYDSNVTTSENSKDARNNALIDIIRGVLLNPNSFAEMTKPGGFDYLKSLADNVLGFEGQTKTKRSYIDPNTQEYLRQANQAGSQLIGLAANHNTNHVLAVDSDFKLVSGIVTFKKEDGTIVDNSLLNQELDWEGEKISQQLGEFLAAFVDNAKDPVANYLNINIFTYDVAALIVRTGFGLKNASYFLAQPILKDFMSFYNNTDKESSNRARTNLATKAVLMKYSKNAEYDDELSYPFSSTELEGMIKDNKTKGFNQGQVNVLSTFLNYKQLASGLSAATSATRADALGLNPTLTGNRLYLDKVENSMSVFAKVDTINVFKHKSTYPMVKAFTEAISVANKSVGQYIPWDTKSMIEARQHITYNTNKTLEEKDIEDINYNGMSYIMSGFEWLKSRENKRKDLLFGDNSVANRVNKIKEDSNYADNYFLRLLRPMDLKTESTRTINFVTPIDKTGVEREMVIDAWANLFLDSNPEAKQLAEDLVLYSFFTSGLVKTRDSFFDYIPFDYLDSIGYINHYEQVKDNMEQEGFMNTFVKQFLKNNFNSDFIPTSSEAERIDSLYTTIRGKDTMSVFATNSEKGGKFIIESASEENPETRWALIVKEGEFLYELDQFNNGAAVYKLTNRLGNNDIKEYSFDVAYLQSIIDSNNISYNGSLNLSDYTEQLAVPLELSENSDTFVEDSLTDKINEISDEEAEQRKKDCE